MPEDDPQSELEPLAAPSSPQIAPARVAQQMIHQLGVQIGPAPNALLEKLDSQHIGQLLTLTENDSKRNDSWRKQAFWGAIIVATAGTLIMCWMFLHYDKPELLKETLALLLTALVSFAGGFGFGRTTKKSDGP